MSKHNNLNKTRIELGEEIRKIVQEITDIEENSSQNKGPKQLNLNPYREGLEDKVKELEYAKISCLFIGPFNSGKSTIINALIRQDLLPMGVTSTTAIPTVVKFINKDEQIKVLVYKQNSQRDELTFQEFKNEYTLNSAKKNKSNHSETDPENTPSYAEFYCYTEVLPQCLELIDTPGTNNHAKSDEEEILYSYIRDSHVIIFVVDAGYICYEQDKSWIQELSEIQKDLNTQQSKSIFYLINKWEQLTGYDDEEKRESVVKEIIDKFYGYLDEEQKKNVHKVFFKKDREKDIYKKLDIENFEKILIDCFEENLLYILKQVIFSTTDILKELKSLCQEELYELQDKLNTLGDKDNLIQAYIDSIKNSFKCSKEYKKLSSKRNNNASDKNSQLKPLTNFLDDQIEYRQKNEEEIIKNIENLKRVEELKSSCDLALQELQRNNDSFGYAASQENEENNWPENFRSIIGIIICIVLLISLFIIVSLVAVKYLDIVLTPFLVLPLVFSVFVIVVFLAVFLKQQISNGKPKQRELIINNEELPDLEIDDLLGSIYNNRNLYIGEKQKIKKLLDNICDLLDQMSQENEKLKHPTSWKA